MNNFLLLVRRFRVFFIFLLFQALSLFMLVKYSKSHQATYLQWAYEVTGRLNRVTSGVGRYFSLSTENKQLAEENNRLRNLLAQNFTQRDTSVTLVADTTWKDSTRLIRKYIWRNARVVNNSVASQTNYITLERGRNQGVETEMAVMGPKGIVGVVTDVSDNMSIVMSLLHRKSATSVMMMRSKINGIIEWDGKNPSLLQLKGIPKSSEVKVGDTVLTSNISLNFPPGLMVGTVAKIAKEEGSNNYLLQIKPATNFYAVDFVNIIENSFLKEQHEIEQKINKQKNN